MTDKLVYCVKTLAVVHWTKLCYKAAAFFIIFKRQMPERGSPLLELLRSRKTLYCSLHDEQEMCPVSPLTKAFPQLPALWFCYRNKAHCKSETQKIKDKYVSFNYCSLTLQGVGGSRDYFKYLCQVPIVDLWHSLSANIGTIDLSPYTINSLFTNTDTFGTRSDCQS